MVLVVKNLPANAGDTRDTASVPELERSPGEGNGNPHQYSCLENSMDSRPPGSSVHGISYARILKWVAVPFTRGSS